MGVECECIEDFIRTVRNVTKKTVAVTLITIISFMMIIYTAHRITHRTKFVPTRINFTNTNILEYMKPIKFNDFYDGNQAIEEIITDDRNIFFLQTAHIKKSHEISMIVRQGCAVESAALMNPTMRVYLFIFADKLWIYTNITKTILQQLSSYKNIFIRHIYLETYFKNSPVDEWWNTTDSLRNSHYFTNHMSDVLRYLTLWKFGGIYLDFDLVVKSSLDNLRDFTAAEDSTKIAAGILGFHLTDVGRRFSNACLFETVTEFRGDVLAYNGLGVVTRALKNTCGTNTICDMDPERCDGLTVFPPTMFHPISLGNRERFFNNISSHKTMRSIANAYAIHVWNHQGQSTVVEVGSGVPYDLIAAKYCPRNYQSCGLTF